MLPDGLRLEGGRGSIAAFAAAMNDDSYSEPESEHEQSSTDAAYGRAMEQPRSQAEEFNAVLDQRRQRLWAAEEQAIILNADQDPPAVRRGENSLL